MHADINSTDVLLNQRFTTDYALGLCDKKNGGWKGEVWVKIKSYCSNTLSADETCERRVVVYLRHASKHVHIRTAQSAICHFSKTRQGLEHIYSMQSICNAGAQWVSLYNINNNIKRDRERNA